MLALMLPAAPQRDSSLSTSAGQTPMSLAVPLAGRHKFLTRLLLAAMSQAARLPKSSLSVTLPHATLMPTTERRDGAVRKSALQLIASRADADAGPMFIAEAAGALGFAVVAVEGCVVGAAGLLAGMLVAPLSLVVASAPGAVFGAVMVVAES